jgi:hypothetical protein
LYQEDGRKHSVGLNVGQTLGSSEQVLLISRFLDGDAFSDSIASMNRAEISRAAAVVDTFEDSQLDQSFLKFVGHQGK